MPAILREEVVLIADHGNAALHLDVSIFPVVVVIQSLEVWRFRKRVWLLVPAVHHHKEVRKPNIPHFLAGAPAQKAALWIF